MPGLLTKLALKRVSLILFPTLPLGPKYSVPRSQGLRVNTLNFGRFSLKSSHKSYSKFHLFKRQRACSTNLLVYSFTPILAPPLSFYTHPIKEILLLLANANQACSRCTERALFRKLLKGLVLVCLSQQGLMRIKSNRNLPETFSSHKKFRHE